MVEHCPQILASEKKATTKPMARWKRKKTIITTPLPSHNITESRSEWWKPERNAMGVSGKVKGGQKSTGVTDTPVPIAVNKVVG